MERLCAQVISFLLASFLITERKLWAAPVFSYLLYSITAWIHHSKFHFINIISSLLGLILFKKKKEKKEKYSMWTLKKNLTFLFWWLYSFVKDLRHYEDFFIFFSLGPNSYKSRGSKWEIPLWKLHCWSADLVVLKKKIFNMFMYLVKPGTFTLFKHFVQTPTLCLIHLNGFGKKGF